MFTLYIGKLSSKSNWLYLPFNTVFQLFNDNLSVRRHHRHHHHFYSPVSSTVIHVKNKKIGRLPQQTRTQQRWTPYYQVCNVRQILVTAAGVVDQLELFMQGKEKAILEEIEDTGQNAKIRYDRNMQIFNVRSKPLMSKATQPSRRSSGAAEAIAARVFRLQCRQRGTYFRFCRL